MIDQGQVRMITRDKYATGERKEQEPKRAVFNDRSFFVSDLAKCPIPLKF